MLEASIRERRELYVKFCDDKDKGLSMLCVSKLSVIPQQILPKPAQTPSGYRSAAKTHFTVLFFFSS